MATAKKSSTKGGGVRFSEEPDASAPTHVHFDDKLHDSVVMVTPEADGNFMVKVGFLKTQTRYEIVFTLPEVPVLGKDVCPSPVPSPHLRITDISPVTEGGLKVTCEYMAQQEGVLCEEVLLLSETDDNVCVRVKVHARVMDQPHPSLLAPSFSPTTHSTASTSGWYSDDPPKAMEERNSSS
ncbi:adipose-secreted signaling protein-like [Diretmus argenteus]